MYIKANIFLIEKQRELPKEKKNGNCYRHSPGYRNWVYVCVCVWTRARKPMIVEHNNYYSCDYQISCALIFYKVFFFNKRLLIFNHFFLRKILNIIWAAGIDCMSLLCYVTPIIAKFCGSKIMVYGKWRFHHIFRAIHRRKTADNNTA